MANNILPFEYPLDEQIEKFKSCLDYSTRVSPEQWANRFKTANKLLLEDYKTANTKVRIQCFICGHIYFTAPNKAYKSVTCLNCKKDRSLSHSQVQADYKMFGHELLELYKGNDKKHLTRFRCGRIQQSIPESVRYRALGCGHCRWTACKRVKS